MWPGKAIPFFGPYFVYETTGGGEWRGIAHILSIFEERDKSLRASHVRTENKQETFLAPPASPSLHRSVRPTGALWKTKLGLLEEDDSSS